LIKPCLRTVYDQAAPFFKPVTKLVAACRQSLSVRPQQAELACMIGGRSNLFNTLNSCEFTA